MPALQALAHDLEDQPFRLYSVDLQEDAEQVQTFQAQHDLHLFALLDENGDVTRAYGVRALPASFLIDKSGVLRQQRLGQLASGGRETAWSADWLRDQVRTLLAAS
jgi:peroxiredoxin